MRIAVAIAILISLIIALGCKNRGTPPPYEPPTSKEIPPPVSPTPEPTLNEQPTLPVIGDEEDRWLFVERTREGSPGGHATGSFDAKRNKISIRTKDVQAFAVETALIDVDWTKPVVISIDGRNSELRKRDQTLLHFVRAPHGEWIVENR